MSSNVKGYHNIVVVTTKKFYIKKLYMVHKFSIMVLHIVW